MSQRSDEFRRRIWAAFPGEYVLIGEDEEVVGHGVGDDPSKLLADYYAANPRKRGGFLLVIEPEGTPEWPRYHSRPRGLRS